MRITKLKRILMVMICLSVSPVANAAISLDRTRAIMNGGDKSISLNIVNGNKQQPYLAQVWVEDAQNNKLMTGPFVATPPVQRLEPEAKGQVKLATTPDIIKLPQDRESLFYFNLREIPPRSEQANVLQIALQTRIKLFYRPETIKVNPNDVWQNKLVLTKENGGYRIENPTPYYVTIIGIGRDKKQAQTGAFDVVMLAPKSTQVVKTESYSTPHLTYINDYGGRLTLKFACSGNRCTAE